MKSNIKWVLGDKIGSRPTATDLLEYAEELLQDDEEMSCCVGDIRVPTYKKIEELISKNRDRNKS